MQDTLPKVKMKQQQLWVGENVQVGSVKTASGDDVTTKIIVAAAVVDQ